MWAALFWITLWFVVGALIGVFTAVVLFDFDDDDDGFWFFTVGSAFLWPGTILLILVIVPVRYFYTWLDKRRDRF